MPYQAAAIYQRKALSLNFGRYVILDRLCRSDSRLLFKAHEPEMNRTVVLMVMSPEAVRSPLAERHAGFARFQCLRVRLFRCEFHLAPFGRDGFRQETANAARQGRK
jgi:hypothetical protein